MFKRIVDGMHPANGIHWWEIVLGDLKVKKLTSRSELSKLTSNNLWAFAGIMALRVRQILCSNPGRFFYTQMDK